MRQSYSIGLVTAFVMSVFSMFPHVAYAVTPNDPFVEQWSFRDVGAYAAWDIAQGNRDVVVALIDNGFDTFHPDLQENVWVNEDEIADNGIDDDGNGYIDDRYGWNFVPTDIDKNGALELSEVKGSNDPRPPVADLDQMEKARGKVHHGTLVAGIIGAVANNNQGIAGINWHVRLMNIRLLSSDGAGSIDALADAIMYAVDNGADVINFSIVGEYITPEASAAIDYAYSHNVVMVAAAGNNGLSLESAPLYPVCSDATGPRKILGVSAITEDHYLASFSNVGSNCIDITAPGAYITSTVRYAPQYGMTDKVSGGWHGTSFAAPFVSATAALVKSMQPHWSATKIMTAILESTHVTPTVITPEYAQMYGHGLLQIDKTVAYVLDHMEKTVLPIRSVSVIDTASGARVSKSLVSEPRQQIQAELQGIDDIAAYPLGDIRYATVTYSHTTRSATVSLLSGAYTVLSSFTLASQGTLRIELADLVGDAAPEIILAPAYASDELFRVYAVSGGLIDATKAKAVHTGIFLARKNTLAKDRVAVGYMTAESRVVTIEIYDGGGRTPAEGVTVDAGLQSLGDFAAVDINGSGGDEYILAAGPDEQAALVYVAGDGSILRKFIAYDTARNAGIHLAAGDYSGNGVGNVVTVMRSGTFNKVRVWDARSKKIDQWDISAIGGPLLISPNY